MQLNPKLVTPADIQSLEKHITGQLNAQLSGRVCSRCLRPIPPYAESLYVRHYCNQCSDLIRAEGFPGPRRGLQHVSKTVARVMLKIPFNSAICTR